MSLSPGGGRSGVVEVVDRRFGGQERSCWLRDALKDCGELPRPRRTYLGIGRASATPRARAREKYAIIA